MNLESLKARLEKLKVDLDPTMVSKEYDDGYSDGANEMQDELMPIIERAIEIAEFYSGLADEVWKTEVYSSLWKETKIIDKGEKARAFLESLKEIK